MTDKTKELKIKLEVTKLIILGLSVLVTGCSPQLLSSGSSDLTYQATDPNQPPTDDNSDSSKDPGVPLNFQRIKNEIFLPKCQQCHQGGSLNFSNHGLVLAQIEQITAAIESNFMPPGGPLSNREKDLIFQWIKEGAH
jgi:hypothetical protein